MTREQLEQQHGQVWDEEQVLQDFSVLGHADPIAVVMRRADGKLGSMRFQHLPRFYWGFVPDIVK